MTGAQRREQLLDATKAIVVADGFHAVSIEAVAREAGITRPIVYGHFEDLGGLLEALVERESMRALAQLPETFDDLLAALTAYLEAVRTDPDTWRLVLMPQEGAPRLLHERIAAGRAAVIARLALALDPAACPTPSSRRTCSPPTPTRPPGSRCRATTWSGSCAHALGARPPRGVILADLSLLRRRRDLRLLIGGYTVSLFGAMFTQVALAVQVYDLTGSTLAVGLLGAAEFVPIVVLALVGGALADAFDRRKLIFGAELTAALVSAALLVNALLAAPQLWVLYVAAALFAGATAVLRPPLDALLPRLVERDELKAASAIHGSLANIATIAGPALAGVLIAATMSASPTGSTSSASCLADRVRADADAAAAADAEPPSPARGDRGPALRRLAPGAARLLRDRHQRDVLRHAVRALPGARRPLRRDARSSGCCGRRRPSARSSRW